MSAAPTVRDWLFTDIVAALRLHGPALLPDDVLHAVIARVERERFDGDDLVEASADDAVLAASWLPPAATASQTRVPHPIIVRTAWLLAIPTFYVSSVAAARTSGSVPRLV